MGTPSADKVVKWLAAAGKTANVSPQLRERVITAGQFIENSARAENTCDLLRGIDFSKPVKVCNCLPQGVYVQFVDHHLGSWFTYKGLLPDQVGLAGGYRERKLFMPIGPVAALESTAKGIKDWWTPGRLKESWDPIQRKFGQLTSGGGVQYLVINKFQMHRI